MNKVKIRFKQLIALLLLCIIPFLVILDFIRFVVSETWYAVVAGYYLAVKDLKELPIILKDIKEYNGK